MRTSYRYLSSGGCVKSTLDILKSLSGKGGQKEASVNGDGKTVPEPDVHIQTGMSQVPYGREFSELFSKISIGRIAADPSILPSAMADLKFSKLDVTIMKAVASSSTDLLVRVLSEDSCDIHSIALHISGETALDAKNVEALLVGISAAIRR